MRSTIQRLLVALALVVVWAPAHAYIDPGTGSALIGAIAAAIAAVYASVKLYWHRLVSFLGGGKTKKDPDESKEEPGNE